jgi:cyclopropane fatty-acyl-phospholipid synthase-like methyltransferase
MTTDSIKHERRKRYWDKNIEGFSKFYDTKSEETLNGSPLFNFLYKRFLMPIEKQYMKKRHANVSSYIKNNVSEGTRFADIGCGSGIYCKLAVECGGTVDAYDFSSAAVSLTNKNLRQLPKERHKVYQLDIIESAIKPVDVAISIGVLTYIDNLSVYLAHILPNTQHFYFNFLDAKNTINKLRNKFLFLDARGYSYHSHSEVLSLLKKYSFLTHEVQALATGHLIKCSRKT